MADQVSEKYKGADASFSEYVGISGPETPKYQILINFLTKYFSTELEFPYQDIIDWEASSNILTEESAEEEKKKLKQAFKAYFDAYTGVDVLTQRRINPKTGKQNRKDRFFPLVPNMLVAGNFNLRSLLYGMQFVGLEEFNKQYKAKKSSQDEYIETQDELIQFLFSGEETDADIHGIIKYICGKDVDFHSAKLKTEPIPQGFNRFKEEKYFKVLSLSFYQQLHLVLKSEILLQTDFYSRMDFLSTFFSLYVLEFLLKRINDVDISIADKKAQKKNNLLIVCKGSSVLEDGNEIYHRASQSCYANIRIRFLQLTKDYYIKQIENVESEKIVLTKDDSGELFIKCELQDSNCSHGDSIPEPMPWLNFFEKINVISSERMSEVTDQANEIGNKIYNDKKGNENGEVIYNKKELAMVYYEIRKREQRAIEAKILSTLPTTARDMNFLFPQNRVRQKYFAMSADIAVFFVRLYLVCKKREYGYYDDFISWLEDEYAIYIRLDAKGYLAKYLRVINASVSEKESSINELAFINNLSQANCLIKLSDSGYIVVSPEKRERVSLL